MTTAKILRATAVEVGWNKLKPNAVSWAGTNTETDMPTFDSAETHISWRAHFAAETPNHHFSG